MSNLEPNVQDPPTLTHEDDIYVNKGFGGEHDAQGRNTNDNKDNKDGKPENPDGDSSDEDEIEAEVATRAPNPSPGC